MRSLILLFIVFVSVSSTRAQSYSADNNNDGCVNIDDMLILLSQFGSCNVVFPCGEVVLHQGYEYSTVQIGNQCWFSENCRYLPSVSPASSGNAVDPFYYVYGYEGADVAEAKSTSNYLTYGTLYNFPAIMLGEMCPTGWHIPTDLEWQVLEVFLGMSPLDASSTGFRGTDQGNQIKSIAGWNNNNGTNTSGFSALPAGYRNPTGVFYSLGNQAYLWNSSVSELSEPWARKLKGGPRILRNVFNQGFGYSIRCISD